jgi:hypothetical protein
MSAPIVIYGPSSAPSSPAPAVESGSELAELAQLQAAEKEEANRQQIVIGIIVAVLGAGAVYLLWRPKKKTESVVQGAHPGQLHAAPPWGASGPPGYAGPPMYGGARVGGAPPGAWAPPHPPRYG